MDFKIEEDTLFFAQSLLNLKTYGIKTFIKEPEILNSTNIQNRPKQRFLLSQTESFSSNDSRISTSRSGIILPPCQNADQKEHPSTYLSADNIRSLIQTCCNDKNRLRSKRDLAILCLIIDTHLSQGKISTLTFGSIKSIIHTLKENGQLSNINYYLKISAFDGRAKRFDAQSVKKMVKMHPLTAWAIGRWVEELVDNWGWNLDDDSNPLFVNLHHTYSYNGEKTLRKECLKRDAISKTFIALKDISGILVDSHVVAASDFSPINGVYLDWIRIIKSMPE
jgi:hypothetical protein